MNDGLLLTIGFVSACGLCGGLITWYVRRHFKLRERDNDALLSANGDFPHVPQMRRPPRG